MRHWLSGHRIVAQSIVPGIFHEHTTKHVYGSMDNGKTVKFEEESHALLLEAAKKTHVAEHLVKEESNHVVKGLYILITMSILETNQWFAFIYV